MIKLTLDWSEVLWWMKGGMSGSHLRRSVYEDMVNRVWPQCSEQERRNLHYVMRRDLGYYWRPDGWSGYKLPVTGEGEWKDEEEISDRTPWMYFRQVLARFDPDQQYAVTMRCPDSDFYDDVMRSAPKSTIISTPTNIPEGRWQSGTATITVRAYRWQQEYYIDWSRRIIPFAIAKAEQLEIPDKGEM